MIFSSPEFLFAFLPLTLAVFLVARRSAGLGAALGFLAGASLVFHAWWNPWHSAVLVGSIGFNWLVSKRLGPGRGGSRGVLVASIAANLLLLGFFKYAAFGAEVLRDAGLIASTLDRIALPLGISFFTFQQIAYLVDRHRGLAPGASLLRYALFIVFFPQLIVGPIVHHSEIMPQLEHARPTAALIGLGLFVFSIGLGKKALLADPLGEFVGPAFASAEGLAMLNAWLAAFAYTLQMYLDFSGYSDMAVGLGLMFGVRLPWNFLSPYKAGDIAEFWRRWHITLSRFLRDYIYIPLGGSRLGPARGALNLFITMFLSGLWHGAGWTFIVWGSLHGLALVACSLWKRQPLRLPRPLGTALTLGVFGLGLVLFRSRSLGEAGAMYRAMFAPGGAPWAGWDDAAMLRAAPAMLIGAAVVFACPNARALSERYGSSFLWPLWGAALLALSVLSVLSLVQPPEFLYFEF